MDARNPVEKLSEVNLELARSMTAAVEEAWQIPRIWFACWWNLMVDSCWPPQDFSRRS